MIRNKLAVIAYNPCSNARCGELVERYCIDNKSSCECSYSDQWLFHGAVYGYKKPRDLEYANKYYKKNRLKILQRLRDRKK